MGRSQGSLVANTEIIETEVAVKLTNLKLFLCLIKFLAFQINLVTVTY